MITAKISFFFYIVSLQCDTSQVCLFVSYCEQAIKQQYHTQCRKRRDRLANLRMELSISLASQAVL